MLRCGFQLLDLIVLQMDQPFILAVLNIIATPSRNPEIVLGKMFKSIISGLNLFNTLANLVYFSFFRSPGKAHVDHALGPLRKFQRTWIRRAMEN